jgi:hypothetical protein
MGRWESLIPLTGAEDVARLAAAHLVCWELPSEREFPLVSETPTVREIIEALGGGVGRPIRYVQITDEQWADAAKERINPHALDHLSHLWRYLGIARASPAYRRGSEDVGSRCAIH